MTASIKSLIKSGTKLWIDSVDPELVSSNFALGATGATSNPIIIADLVKTGRFDDKIKEMSKLGHDPETTAWKVTNHLVSDAEKLFLSIFNASKGDDGYVSFELDPLLEDTSCKLSVEQRAEKYIELGKSWARNHPNRMIKVPATPAGLASLEELAAAAVPLNVTLIFSSRQYQMARDAVWRGAQRLTSLERFKSVYSIFVSRIDVYTAEKYPTLSPSAQGLAGIVNAQILWQENQAFWQKNKTPLKQEIIFASTGTKSPSDKPWKYVEALAGSDIQTNPPKTNDAVAESNQQFTRKVDQFPAQSVVDEIVTKIDWHQLESDLMADGLAKFANPHKALIDLIAQKSRS
jgi:transaldolase